MVNLEAYFKLEIDHARRLAIAKRTAEKYPSLATAEKVFAALGETTLQLPKGTFSLLLDLRDGPLRNDEGFEATVRKYAEPLFDGWRKSAMLVRSAVGELQLSRQSRERGIQRNVFRDETEALRFLEA